MAAGATEIFGPLIYTVCLISNYSAVSYFRMESERLTTSTDVHIVEGKGCEKDRECDGTTA